MENPPIDPTRAPFVWLTPDKLPLNLLDPKSVAQFAERAQKIDAEMGSRFGLPLVMMFFDTVIATAGYQKSGDENDPVINARMMRDGLMVMVAKPTPLPLASIASVRTQMSVPVAVSPRRTIRTQCWLHSATAVSPV
jgi:hypothetical protein